MNFSIKPMIDILIDILLVFRQLDKKGNKLSGAILTTERTSLT